MYRYYLIADLKENWGSSLTFSFDDDEQINCQLISVICCNELVTSIMISAMMFVKDKTRKYKRVREEVTKSNNVFKIIQLTEG